MKISDVPKDAFKAQPTPLPTKVVTVYDWEALYQTMHSEGFIVIESENIRAMPNGSDECTEVKNFNNFCRNVKNVPLYTKRISHDRWVCCL